MNKLKTRFILICLMVSYFLLKPSISMTQSELRIDSLKNQIENTKDQNEQVQLLIDLGEIYSTELIDSLYSLADEIILLSEEIDDPCSRASGIHYKANYYSEIGEVSEALKLYLISLEIRKNNCEIERIASSCINIGNMYGHLGEYEEAYQYYYQSLHLYEKLENYSGISFIYSNLGVLDVERNKFDQAKEHYALSMEFEKKSTEPDSINLGNIYNNYGGMYEVLEMYDTAIYYFQRAMDIYQAKGHTSGLSHGYNNIGIIYFYQGFKDSCMSYFKQSLKIRKDIGDKRAVAQSYNNIGILYMYSEIYSLAIAYADSSLDLALSAGFKEEISEAYLGKYETYFEWGDYYEATINLKLYGDYKDTLTSEAGERSIRLLETKFETIKKEKEIQEKNLAIEQHEASGKRKNLILIAAAFLTLLLAAFALVIFNRNKFTKRQNLIIAEQKVIVEEKQKEIIDSIKYAKRIQEALLKSEEHESEHLPEHFVMFKPKDIVSGDFYWVHERDEFLYLAVADCTGHGVPGGFLSMLGCSFLNEIVSGEENHVPAKILDELRDRIVRELSQTGEKGENRDGMDISLVRLNLTTNEMMWSGANNPLWLIRENGGEMPESGKGIYFQETLMEILPDKQPIGHHWVMKPFTNRVVQLEKGDSFYLFSDGYADQFGGEKGKKFKYKPLKELILKLKNKPMIDRKNELDRVFIDWMGSYEQIDDLCMVGVRI
jgi:tetratricopeptide (TPR) repeat protein